MYLCKYNLSKECKGTHKDCVNCVLEDIKVEIQNEISRTIRDEYSQRQNDYCDGVEWAFKHSIDLIDKHISGEES